MSDTDKNNNKVFSGASSSAGYGQQDTEARSPRSRQHLPGERPLKLWGERVYSILIYWNEVARGGHFAALEQPNLFVAELPATLATLR